MSEEGPYSVVGPEQHPAPGLPQEGAAGCPGAEESHHAVPQGTGELSVESTDVGGRGAVGEQQTRCGGGRRPCGPLVVPRDIQQEAGPAVEEGAYSGGSLFLPGGAKQRSVAL